MGEGAFYSRRANPAQSFFTRYQSRTVPRVAGLCVRKRLAETRLLILQFAGFQYLPAIQAFHVLRIFILGNQLCSFVLAGKFGC